MKFKALLILIFMITPVIAKANDGCINSQSKPLRIACKSTLVGIYGTAFYFLGKNSAESAGHVQSLMWLFSWVNPEHGDTTLNYVFHHSLAAFAIYNYTHLEQYDIEENDNDKAALFNGVVMTLWALGTLYADTKKIDEQGLNVKFTQFQGSEYGLSFEYKF